MQSFCVDLDVFVHVWTISDEIGLDWEQIRQILDLLRLVLCRAKMYGNLNLIFNSLRYAPYDVNMEEFLSKSGNHVFVYLVWCTICRAAAVVRSLNER